MNGVIKGNRKCGIFHFDEARIFHVTNFLKNDILKI